MTSADTGKTGGKKAYTVSAERGPQGEGISDNPEPATRPPNAGLKPTPQYDSTATARSSKAHTKGTKTQMTNNKKKIIYSQRSRNIA